MYKLILFLIAFAGYFPLIGNSKDSVYVTIHHSKTVYKIESLNDMEELVEKNFTIHSDKGDDAATMALFYDKGSKIASVELEVRNDLGMVKKYKLKDFEDRAMNDGYSIFSDNRLKLLTVSSASYPVHFNLQYTVKHKSTSNLTPWMPQEDYRYKLEHAELIIQSQIPDFVKFKELNFKGKSIIQPNELKWELDNLAPIEDEGFDKPMAESFVRIMLATHQFILDGHKGELGSWQQYGQWMNGLIQDRDLLSPEDKIKINSLVNDKMPTRTKIMTLYKYLQQNTRYVSIQLGIGGFQPMTATEVSKAGYGDCKALSNYMRAMLKSIGVESYYTVIGNGGKKINSDFASFYQTNHAILTVPIPKDTMFLECTSPYFPPGYLGGSNSDRYAIMATPEGGQLIRTPIYNEQTNILSSHANVKLLSTGNISTEINLKLSGMLYEGYDDFEMKDMKQKKELVVENHSGINFELDSFEYHFDYSIIPAIELKEHGNVNKYASVSGTRMFIPLTLLHQTTPEMAATANRTNDIVVSFGFAQNDTLSISLPSGYMIESLPKPVSIHSIFGELEFKPTILENKIEVVLNFKVYKTTSPKETYAEFSELLNKVSKIRQSKIVLKKVERP